MLNLEKVEFFCNEVDRHLNEIEIITTLLKEVKNELSAIREFQKTQYSDEILQMKEDLSFLKTHLEERGLTPTDLYEKEFIELKKLVISDFWPEAVEPNLLCDLKNKKDVMDCSEAIMDVVISEYLKDLNFLDFGCGSGCMSTVTLKQQPKLVVAYDIKEHSFWDSLKIEYPSVKFTTSMDEVRQCGLYDIIFLHDVLDHIVGDPIRVLKDISEILAYDGKVFITCHPWCSRHGSHLYDKINRAFVHLVFDETELARMGYQAEHTLRIQYPLIQYKDWFKQAGFEIIQEDIKFTKAETFFKDKRLKERIMRNWPESDKNFPEHHMSIDFIHYILKPSKEQKITDII